MSTKTKFIIFFFCLVKLTLHLIADSHSGFQGDELLHIETGKHLAFGYMEFPPLIALLAFIQNLFGSQSVFVHHIFSHIASLIIMICVAKTTIELGGKNTAIALVLSAIVIAPGFERSQQLFQPVVFSQMFWVLAFYQLVRFVKNLDKQSLWLLTLLCVLGFLTKYDTVFFLFGIIALLYFRRTRSALIQHKFYLDILVFIFAILPNIIWQIKNDFPLLQMTARLYQTQLNGITRGQNLINLVISINPIVSLLFIIPALVYFIKSKDIAIRVISATILLSFVFLLFKNGKAYYFFSIILTVLPFGAIYLEQLINQRNWTVYPISFLMLAGMILIPFGMPVYSFERYLIKVQPFESAGKQGGRVMVKFDEYYTAQKWKTTMQDLKSVYDSLPANEKRNCLIWGKHYSDAGAVNLFGKDYGLPRAFSYHGSFYSWAPSGKMPTTVIAVSHNVGNFFQDYFDDVKLVKSIYNPYAVDDEEIYERIYICKRPKQDFGELKEIFKKRIFE